MTAQCSSSGSTGTGTGTGHIALDVAAAPAVPVDVRGQLATARQHQPAVLRPAFDSI